MIDKHFTSDRLLIKKITEENDTFLLELVNTPGWLEFIGDKKIHDKEAALAYIQSIIANKKVAYWIVYVKEKQVPIGVISLIKRDYLPHYDLGFAFLPQFNGVGYAYEATYSVLNYLITLPEFTSLVGITLEANTKSKSLLKRLGFRFDKLITADDEVLEVYEISTDSFAINELYHCYF